MELVEHIGIFKNALPSENCRSLIKFFDDMKKQGFVYKRQDRGHQQTAPTTSVDDTSYAFRQDSFDVTVYPFPYVEAIREAINMFWACYEKYSLKYGVLKTMDRHQVLDGKLQKTAPQEGYHVWHCENAAAFLSRRLATFMFYLNDIEDGGETEFLYQSLRIKPTEGTLLIWPASYTHTHRGNPPLKEDKYVFTGWVEFTTGD